MENNIIDKPSKAEKIVNLLKENKKIIITVALMIAVIIIGLLYLDYSRNKKNDIISEKYVKAGIYFTSNNKKKSNEIYQEIVLSRNEFYSVLALNTILENNLEEDNEKVLSLFKEIEDISNDKDQKDLIKLKKSLFLMKISRKAEAKKILNEIIASDSIWKSTALEISK